MITHIALLRGINVSGKKTIKMDDLKIVFESLHYRNVKTYIQSGNVVFTSPGKDSDKIAAEIESRIRSRYAFGVIVILRTIGEMEKVMELNPYVENNIRITNGVYVTFLSAEPSIGAVKSLSSVTSEADECRIYGKEAYIRCRGSYGKTMFSNAFIEKKLGIDATTRNWNTIQKLVSMGKAEE